MMESGANLEPKREPKSRRMCKKCIPKTMPKFDIKSGHTHGPRWGSPPAPFTLFIRYLGKSPLPLLLCLSGIWYHVSAIRYQVSGSRYLVSVSRVFGIMYMLSSVRYLVFCIRYVVSGSRYSISGIQVLRNRRKRHTLSTPVAASAVADRIWTTSKLESEITFFDPQRDYDDNDNDGNYFHYPPPRLPRLACQGCVFSVCFLIPATGYLIPDTRYLIADT